MIDDETRFTALRDITGLHMKGPWRLIVIAQQLAVVRDTDGVVRPWHQIEILWSETTPPGAV